MEKQSLKNEIPGFSLASLRQEVCTSTQCVPVPLPSSQYSTELNRGIKGSKIYEVPTRFCGTGSWGQKGNMCLYVYGRFQSKLNALLDTTNPAEGEQCSHTNCFAQSLYLLLRTSRPTDGKREGKADPNSSAAHCSQQASAWRAAASRACL